MELEPVNERRYQHGVAVISLRRIWLMGRLQAAGASFRHVVIPQLGPTILPQLRPPLLLDTAEMPLPMLVAILWELSRVRSLMPTLALVSPDQPGLARLVALPLAVGVVIADRVPADVLGLWLRSTSLLKPRAADTPPAEVEMEPPSAGLLNLPPFTLDALRALAPYGDRPPASITEAAERAGISRRLFCYQLAALRAVVGLSPVRRYRPPALASAICAALTVETRQTPSPRAIS